MARLDDLRRDLASFKAQLTHLRGTLHFLNDQRIRLRSEYQKAQEGYESETNLFHQVEARVRDLEQQLVAEESAERARAVRRQFAEHGPFLGTDATLQAMGYRRKS